jgi:hypothetical protein
MFGRCRWCLPRTGAAQAIQLQRIREKMRLLPPPNTAAARTKQQQQQPGTGVGAGAQSRTTRSLTPQTARAAAHSAPKLPGAGGVCGPLTCELCLDPLPFIFLLYLETRKALLFLCGAAGASRGSDSRGRPKSGNRATKSDGDTAYMGCTEKHLPCGNGLGLNYLKSALPRCYTSSQGTQRLLHFGPSLDLVRKHILSACQLLRRAATHGGNASPVEGCGGVRQACGEAP